MITQQVASYLIKKMETAVKKPASKVEDKTDELFKHYLSTKDQKKPADVIVNGTIDNAAIVEAFRWRAADLVSPFLTFFMANNS
jgi:acyl-CoA oxidase